jgi:hypothetical protein
MKPSFTLSQLPLKGESLLTLRFREDGYWVLILLQPISTLCVLGVLLLLVAVSVVVQPLPSAVFVIVFGVATAFLIVSICLLPIALYRDIQYVSTLSASWSPPAAAYVGLGLIAVLLPALADPLAIAYLYRRAKHTEFGPESIRLLY